MNDKRFDDLVRFHSILDTLEQSIGGAKTLADSLGLGPHSLKNPRPVGAESKLTENVASPFQAEPRDLDIGGATAFVVQCPAYASTLQRLCPMGKEV